MERGHQIETRNTAYFRHDYDCEHADMRRLYEQAKIDQRTRRPTSTGLGRSKATMA